MTIRNICQSGGAEGSDLAWGDAARRHGHDVVHYVFKGHKGSNHPDAVIVTPEELKVGDKHLKKVNEEVLHRSFPAHSDFVTNLLRRNYKQVEDTQAVYAIAGIDEDGIVIGGTAWAVHLYISMRPGSNSVYVYDSWKDQWFAWRVDDLFGIATDPRGWEKIDKPPVPSGRWTGIGTRDLDAKGRAAIESVFVP